MNSYKHCTRSLEILDGEPVEPQAAFRYNIKNLLTLQTQGATIETSTS